MTKFLKRLFTIPLVILNIILMVFITGILLGIALLAIAYIKWLFTGKGLVTTVFTDMVDNHQAFHEWVLK